MTVVVVFTGDPQDVVRKFQFLYGLSNDQDVVDNSLNYYTMVDSLRRRCPGRIRKGYTYT